MNATRLNAVSLFSNCGAGDVGFRDAGFDFAVIADIDYRRLTVASVNHSEAQCVEGDLRLTWRQVIRAYRSKKGNRVPDLLAACPPCQGMSSAHAERGKASSAREGSRDKRNLLVVPIANVARALNPRIIVVENVSVFLKRKVLRPKRHERSRHAVSAAGLLIEMLEGDYDVFPFLSDLCDYGIPQSRRRAFLTFVRKGDPVLLHLKNKKRVPYPVPRHSNAAISISRALARAKLSSLDAASRELAFDSRDPFHFVPVWERRQYAMVAAIRSNSGRSAWENNKCEKCGRVEVDNGTITCPHCNSPLLRPLVKSKGRWRFVYGFTNSSYRRMDPKLPAATITTASGRVSSDLSIHPSENRVLSPRECAFLQTLPKSFRWGYALETWGQGLIRDMIGEAVPPRFTRLHGRVLYRLLMGQSTRLVSGRDVRVRRANQSLSV